MNSRLSRFVVFAIILSLFVETPGFSQRNRNGQFGRQQQQDQWRRQQADEQRRRAQEDQRRQLQQWQQQQRQQMADQQRRQMLENQRQQRMAEMLRQQQSNRLQGAMRAQQAGRPAPGGVPNALASKATDRMVFPNGVAKLTRPLTPAEVRRGFTGKITPDGRALVKFRNRVFAVPASGLGLKLGSDAAPTRTQLMSGTSLSPAPGTASRLSVKEKTALTGTIQQLVAASTARHAQERAALARSAAAKGPQAAGERRGRAGGSGSSGGGGDEPPRGTDFTQSARLRQETMLKANVGFNVSPLGWDRYGTLGTKGTFVTDKKAISDVLGEIPEGKDKIVITGEKARLLEDAMGLEKNSLSGGFKIRQITGLNAQRPASPLEGNELFQGPGKHLPGGGPELLISPVPTSGPSNVTRVIEVLVQ